MALTYTVRDKRTLLADQTVDTSGGMAIVRADITIGTSTDYNSTTTGTGASAPGVPLIASNLGLGATGSVLQVLGMAVRGSTSDSIPKLVMPVYDAAKNSVRFYSNVSASATTASPPLAEIVQSNVTTGDIVRVTLVGQVGN